MRGGAGLTALAAGLVAGSLLTGCSGGGSAPAVSAAGTSTGVPAPAAGSAADATPSSAAAPAPATGVPVGTSPSGAAHPATTSPVRAGAAVATLVSSLPTGAARGHVTVDLDGLGELTGPFTGTCTRTGSSTQIAGTSDTASVRLSFAPTASTLAFSDSGGVASHGNLAAGDYRVSGSALQVGTDLLGDTGRMGRIQLTVTCGG